MIKYFLLAGVIILIILYYRWIYKKEIKKVINEEKDKKEKAEYLYCNTCKRITRCHYNEIYAPIGKMRGWWCDECGNVYNKNVEIIGGLKNG